MTQVIPFPAIKTPLPCIALRKAPSFAEADAILASVAKKYLVKRTPTFINGPANLLNKVPRYPPDCMILDN